VAATDSHFSLVCRVGALLCTLPVAHVLETMRPLPLDSVPGAPDAVAGMAVVHGVPLPVIALGRLFGATVTHPERLIIVRAGTRRVGLEVDAVLGFRSLNGAQRQGLPPLLGGASEAAISAIGTLDGELMVVLEAARIVSAETFAAIDASGAHP
jgi:purine-binding chemotaxis protein CheW